MAENQKNIDALMEKLEILTRQQALFQNEINSLRSEIQKISTSTSEKSSTEQSTTTVPESRITPSFKEEVWPTYIDLVPIKRRINYFETEKTSKGVEIVKITLENEGNIYKASFAANGNWMVEDENGNRLLRGVFKDNGRTVKFTEGSAIEGTFRNSSLEENISIGLGIGSLKIVNSNPVTEKSVEENIKEPVRSVSAPDLLSDTPRQKSGVESFIGENLINVIGIIIVLIGVVFGVKYSIDHNLISPLMRILLSYLLGIGFLVTGIKLKKKYEQFSAVLVSGSIAIMYFVTFIAYSLYDLFPQLPAFIMDQCIFLWT